MLRPLLFSVAAGALLMGAATAHAQAFDPNHRFNIAIGIQPDTTDPMTTALTPNVLPVFGNIQDELVPAVPDAIHHPTIATWDIKDGGKVVEFHIKPGVKFQSGDPLTADDVVFTHERGMAKAIAYKIQMVSLDHVEKVDNMTVRWIYKTPNISLLTQGAFFVGSKTYFDRVGEKEYMEHPMGTGPYKLTDYKLGQYYDLDAWDGYWGPKPKIPHVRFSIVKEETTQVQMLKTGEADLIEAVPYNQVEALKKLGFNTAGALTTPGIAINFDMYNPTVPWAKKAVREAIAHAIDNDAIIKGLLSGIPKNDGILTPGEIGYGENLGPYKYDPVLAKKMLADAGYPKGFTMPYYVPNNYYGQQQTAEAVSLYLKAVGVNLDVKQMDAAEINKLLAQHGKEPTIEFVYQRSMPVSNNGDPAGAIPYTFSKNSATSEFKTDNPDFEASITQAAAIVDPVERGKVINKILSIIHDDVGVINIWNAVTMYAMKPIYTYAPIDHELPRVIMQDIQVKQ